MNLLVLFDLNLLRVFKGFHGEPRTPTRRSDRITNPGSDFQALYKRKAFKQMYTFVHGDRMRKLAIALSYVAPILAVVIVLALAA